MKILLFSALFLMATFITNAQSTNSNASGMQTHQSGKEKKKHKKHHKKHGKHHKKSKSKSTTFVAGKAAFA